MGNPETKRKDGETVGTPISRVENQTKHLTDAERSARAEAEAAVLPDRGREADLEKPPRALGAAACRYWRDIVRRMDGLAILDDLDREMLGVYCQMLARRDKLQHLLEKLLTAAASADLKGESAEQTDKLDSLAGKIATLERTILQYADKLGLTPQGRVRLAQKRAAAAMAAEADADLFGDG